MSRLEAALISDLGGEDAITTLERILITAVVVKAFRVNLLAYKLMDDGEAATGDEHHVLAWANSLRNDCLALGLKRRARDVGLPGERQPSNLRELAAAAVVEAHAA